jgi:hypothetical protein
MAKKMKMPPGGKWQSRKSANGTHILLILFTRVLNQASNVEVNVSKVLNIVGVEGGQRW